MGLLDVLKVVADPIGSAVGAVGGLATSLVNAHSQKETNKRNAEMNAANNEFNAEQSELQRNWSANEAAKARAFDTSERQAQQKWQEQMIQMQNEWNSPAHQLELMQEAGLNPASFDGAVSSSASPTGTPSGSSVGVPSGASATAASPAPYQAPRYDFDFAQTQLALAQARRINTDTNSEKTRQKYLDALYQGEVDEQNTRIHLNLQGEKLSRAQEDEIIANTNNLRRVANNLSATYDYLRAQTANMEEDTVSKIFNNEHAVETLAASLRNMNADTRAKIMQGNNYRAQAKLFLQEAEKAYQEGRLLKFQMYVNKATGNSQINLIRTEAAQANFDFVFDKKFRGFNQSLNAGTQLINSITGAVQTGMITYRLLKGFGKGVPVRQMNMIPGTGIPNLNPVGFSVP